jgi:Lamin Tail Domain
MRSILPGTGRTLAALLATAALAACGDQQPVGARQPVIGQPDADRPETVVQALDCVASVRDGVSCRAAGAGESGASRVIYGGQNVFVRLASANAGYDGGTGIFSVDVTLQNLMNEAIGSPDGVTPDPDGIRIFFHEEPTAVTGTGSVTVANADGTAFFTSADQPYHRYTEILDRDEVSSVKTWQFAMDPTVESFRFTVYLESDVQYLLVINEVMVNPANFNANPDATGEWFEIFNAGTRSVDLQDLVIADSAASGRRPYHLITSSLVVQSGGYVVLGNSTNTSGNGGVPVDYAYGSALTLANSLDAIKIARVFGTDTLTVDRTQYASAAISAQDGISRELKNPALDNSNMDGSNWGSASVTSVYGSGGRGTPKAQNSVYTP